MKTYKRYTKANLEKDLDDYGDIKIKTVSGRATYVTSKEGWLNMTLNGSRCYIRHDDVVKEAAKHLTGKDQIEITYFRDRWEDEIKIISFVNHTKNVSVINQRFTNLIEALTTVKERRSKQREFLSRYTTNAYIILLTKKQEDGSEVLVDIDNAIGYDFTHTDDRYGVVNKVLDRNGIVANVGNWFHIANYNGRISIPEDKSYRLYVLEVASKRRRCSCGADPYENEMRNHSIIFGQHYAKRYMCEYCFLDEMKIQITEEMFKETMKGKEENV